MGVSSGIPWAARTTAVHIADGDPPRTVLTVSPIAFGALVRRLKSSGGR